MKSVGQHSFLENIRSKINRQSDRLVPQAPSPVAPRHPGSAETEIDTLIHEINALSGEARRMRRNLLDESLTGLVTSESIRKALLWETPFLKSLELNQKLENLGVEIVPVDSGVTRAAECELGITEVDFALPETGTLCLLADDHKPQITSLLPRIHLAIVDPQTIRPDIHQVMDEAKEERYLVFITGPSRTADIELTVALGVHGPQKLIAWIMD
jgi:L-lactate dehydrogenase complex protein LldG